MDFWFQILKRLSQKKWLIANILIIVGLFVVMVAGGDMSGKNMVPDLSFGYPASYIKTFLENIDSGGRKAYVASARIDLVYMFFYTSLFMALIFSIYKPIIKNQKVFFFLTLSPLLALFFDILETVNLLFSAISFPVVQDWQSQLIAFSTSAKWISIGGIILVIVTGSIMILLQNKKPSLFFGK